jgi:hypothetical protein
MPAFVAGIVVLNDAPDEGVDAWQSISTALLSASL